MLEVPDYPVTPFLGFADPVSSLLHLGAAAVSVWFGIGLISQFNGERYAKVSLGIYLFGVVFMFSMSGTYHLLEQGGTARYVLKQLDHAAIWIMIAGTFTPFHMILLSKWERWGVLGPVWIAAITGLVLKTIFFDNFPEWLGLLFYLALGWLGLFSGKILSKQYGWYEIRYLGYGGIAYSVGAIFEFLQPPFLLTGVVGPHEIFHVAIIFGVYYHWRLIEKLCINK